MLVRIFYELNLAKFSRRKLAPEPKETKAFLGRNLPAPIFEMMTVSTIMIAIEGQMSEPKALIIVEEE